MKLYVMVDSSLNMPKGKLCRQVAGAVTGVIFYHLFKLQWYRLVKWFLTGQVTIVLKEPNLQDIDIKDKHIKMIDAGKTVFKKPTLTCIAFPLIKRKNNFNGWKLL